MSSGVLLLAAGVVLVAIPAWIVARARGPVRQADVAWLAGSDDVGPEPGAVYVRYLQRHRIHRLVGGLLGAGFAAVVGVRWYGTVRAGIGDVSPLGDVLFGALAGIVAGALSAESFRLDEPRTDVVTASLAQRPPPAGRTTTLVARGLAVAGVLAGTAVLALGGGATALVTALVTGAVVVLAEVTRAAVVGRRRPVLSAEADRVDRRLRGFAQTAVARLELAAATLGAGWVVSALPLGEGVWPQVGQVLLVLTALVATIVLLRRAAPRASRRPAVVAA